MLDAQPLCTRSGGLLIRQFALLFCSNFHSRGQKLISSTLIIRRIIYSRGKTPSTEKRRGIQFPEGTNDTNLFSKGFRCVVMVMVLVDFTVSSVWCNICDVAIAIMGVCVRRVLAGIAVVTSPQCMLLILRLRPRHEADFPQLASLANRYSQCLFTTNRRSQTRYDSGRSRKVSRWTYKWGFSGA